MQEFMTNQILVNEVICGILAGILLSLLVLLFRKSESAKMEEILAKFKRDAIEREQILKQDIQGYLNEAENDEVLRLRELKQDVNNMLGTHRETVASHIVLLGETQEKLFNQLRIMTEQRLHAFDESQSKGMMVLNDTVARQMNLFSEGQTAGMKRMAEILDKMRNENERKLEEIRGTVNEQLQTTLEKRITESFKTVNDQLQQVYRGLGEMKNLATDVGGLKKVLSNVKTRGILGEVQLKSILQEILTFEQYDENVATIPNSLERVEFAVKMPGDGENGFVYLPIDAKFPNDTYQKLLEARDTGDKEKIEQAYKELENVVKREAKDIRTKYVSVPHTTNFGIMFLASEGLYAEVVNRGLMQVLQHDYQISVTGPSTMAAFLNSLRMGFNTLAIQKRSNEVWQVLGGVKSEFAKFGVGLQKMQEKINSANKELEELVGKRTRAINRKLRDVQELDIHQAEKVLQLNSAEE